MKNYSIILLISILIITSCSKKINHNLQIRDTILVDDSVDYWQKIYYLNDIYNFRKEKFNYFKTKESAFIFQKQIKKRNNNPINDNYYLDNVSDFLIQLKKNKKVINLNIEEDSILLENNSKTKVYYIDYNYKNKIISESILEEENKGFRSVWNVAEKVKDDSHAPFYRTSNLDRTIPFPVSYFKSLAKENQYDQYETYKFITDYFKEDYTKIDEYYSQIFNYSNLENDSKMEKIELITRVINNLNFSGNYTKARQVEESFYKRGNKRIDSTTFTIQKITPFIDSISKTNDIILLNENHFYEDSRYVATFFIDKLADKGFNYFAAESFAKDKINENTTIQLDNLTGYYIDQPSYSNVISLALKKNFKLVEYENFDICENSSNFRSCRDSMQAVGISNIFKENPKAMVFVLAGHGHINKSPSKDWKFMRMYLSEMLPNKNIISIDQANLYNNRGFREQLTQDYKITEPIHLKSNNEAKYNKVDAFIACPVFEQEGFWYYQESQIFNQKIEFNFPKNAFYVEVFQKEMFENRKAPVFKSNRKDLPQNHIYLPENEYIIQFRDFNFNPL